MANPFEGGKQAVAEAFRNLSASGALPLATTDNMNFGNPVKPEILGQFVGCIKGIGEAVSALDMPIVSGNVSLYNETDGTGILPTPTIGAVGLLADLSEIIKNTPNDSDTLVLIGNTDGHLGQSALLKEMFDREDGDAPHVDLAAEKAAGEFVRAAHKAGLITAAHDISDGGLAVAALEMAMSANVGVKVMDGDTGWFFGEDQARYLLATQSTDALVTAAKEAGIPVQVVGDFTGDIVSMGDKTKALSDLTKIYATSLHSRVV
jgi:phosphoribosylformylglycinamidine synthase